MAWSQSAKLGRYKYFLKFMFMKYKPICYFCGKKLDWKDFYPQKYNRKQLDSFSMHHEDGNRKNNKPENLKFAHRRCHLGFHRKLEGMLKKYKNDTVILNKILESMSLLPDNLIIMKFIKRKRKEVNKQC